MLCNGNDILCNCVYICHKKEKAAGLISGFNSLPKEEQKNYDTARMVLDMRADVQTWATLFLFGGVITYMVSQW